jgi:hypothetical protein
MCARLERRRQSTSKLALDGGELLDTERLRAPLRLGKCAATTSREM